MVTPPRLPGGVYAIADSSLGDPTGWARALIEAGAPVVQLRAKGWAEARLVAEAAPLAPLARARGTVLIINDHAELAAAIGAAGVHLGQEDGPARLARRVLGPRALIGRSTHTPGQVREALADPDVDYLGFGPVFATSSKDTGYSARGLRALTRAVGSAASGTPPKPIVAIGGITALEVPLLQAAGATGWAVISALHPPGADAGGGDPPALDVLREILAALGPT